MPIKESAQLPNVEYKFLFMMDVVSQDILGNGLLQEAIHYIDESVKEGVNILIHWYIF